ncbi:MAG: alpha/beta hydrolase [Methylovirgula sp.]
MRASEAEILIVPGLGGSGPEHWQSRWQAKLSTARRIEQEDFERPRLEAWRRRIIAEVEAAEKPVVLVAHSLGVLAVAHAAAELDGKVRGAFLVAPPSPRAVAEIDAIDAEFGAVPLTPLPFPAVLVASRDDSYAQYHETEELARAWHARLLDAGAAGHINAESGYGPWPEGLLRFAKFLRSL